MRKHKLILSNVLTVLLVLLTSFSVLSQPLVSAVDTTNFDVYVYMADNMLTSNTVAGKSLKYYTNEYMTLAEIMRDSMTDKFRNSVIAWEDINLALSPSDIAEKPIEAYGYYTTVLLSMLKCTYENEPTSAAIGFAKNSKSVSSLYGDFAKFYKLNAKADLDEILELPNLSKSQKDELTRLQKEWLEGKGWLKTSEACGNIMKVVGAIDDVNKGVERFVQYSMLCQVNSEWQESLQYMYTHCDKSNEPLKQALNTIIESSKSYELGIAYSIKDAVVDADAAVAGIIIDGLVDIIVEEFPIIKGMQIGQSVGKTISNMLFATDKTIEKFYIVNAYCEILDLFKASYNNAKNTYLNSKTSENAQKFITYTDMYFTTLDIGGDFGMDFLKTIYSGGILNSLFGSAEEYEQVIESNEECRQYAKDAHKTITTSWLIDLYTDNPEMYEIYAPILQTTVNSYVEPTRVEFESESVEWGLEDTIYYGHRCTVYPSSANCKQLIFTSSDPSIVTFQSNGRVKLLKPGKCTITATSVEYEDLYDTLEVTVVVGSGADGKTESELTGFGPVVLDEDDLVYSIDNGQVTIKGYVSHYPNIILPDTIEGYPVTAIGGIMLQNTTRVSSVVIPEGVTIIGESTFANCKGLTEITFPNTLKEIQSKAFRGCTSLSSVKLPNSLTSIGYMAFDSCENLTSVEIPNMLTAVNHDKIQQDNVLCSGDYGLFGNCYNLKSITFAPGTTKVPDYLFVSCPGIESITIPDGIKTIGKYAFWSCENLKKVIISDTVENIEESAFNSCTSLSNLKLPNALVYTDGCVFWGCDSLTSIEIPNEFSLSFDYAFNSSYGLFSGCNNLKNVTFAPGTTKVPDCIFKKCDSIESITIPDGIKTIGHDAFAYCGNLKEVLICDTVESIEGGAFVYCTSLSNVKLSNTLTSIGGDAFLECDSLTNIEIPSTLTSAYRPFDNCDNLKDITFTAGITKIPDNLFELCSGIESITIPDGILTIGNSAFENCRNLKEIFIPNTVECIEEDAFRCCTSLSNVKLPNSLTSIGERAFFYCGSLTNIEIPSTLTSLSYGSYGPFDYCDNLKNVTFAPGTTKVPDYLFKDCIGIESITIPTGITIIGESAFYGCENLKEVIIPDTVENIDGYAFYNCKSLSSIIIPSNATTIDSAAFYGCTNLTIYGYSGSYAETYAYENKIPFVSIDGISISLQPQSTTLIEGFDTSLLVSASGSNLTYQWQEYDGSGWATLIGETRATLTIKNADSCRNGYKYRCIVSDGNSSVTSEEAILTVTSSSSVTLDQVKAMSIEELIAFVNGIPNNDNIILTEAQLYAIQKVLQYDLGRTA